MMLPDPSLPWPVPMSAVALIAESEGLRLRAYRCPAGVPSIGWGETDGVHMGDTCTKEQADRWLCEDLTDRARAVRALCTVEPAPAELGAMLSLAYNVGVPGFRTSTVLRQHNAGNRQAAARAFGLWNKARDRNTGQLVALAGLTARRAREAAMYLSGDDERPAPMPQAVEPESKTSSGPIVKAGTLTAGAGVVGMLGPLGEHIAAVKATLAAAKRLIADTLRMPPGWVLPLLLIAAGVVVVRYRMMQRSEGWA